MLDRIAAAVRLAEQLERPRDQSVHACDVVLEDGTVELRLHASGDVRIARWAAERQGELFRRAFSRELVRVVDGERIASRLDPLMGWSRSLRSGCPPREGHPTQTTAGLSVSITFALVELARWWGCGRKTDATTVFRPHPLGPRPFRPPNRSEVARQWRAHRRQPVLTAP